MSVHAISQIAGPFLADILAREAYPALQIASDEMRNRAVQRAGQRGSAGAAPSEQTDQFARSDVAGDTREGGLFSRPVAEGDVVEANHERECCEKPGGMT